MPLKPTNKLVIIFSSLMGNKENNTHMVLIIADRPNELPVLQLLARHSPYASKFSSVSLSQRKFLAE